MGEFLDFGTNMLAFVTALKGEESSSQLRQLYSLRDSQTQKTRMKSRKRVDPKMFNVRDSICIAGTNYKAVLRVKALVDRVMETPSKVLESFHIKTDSDVRDGALLVPKVILVATYCPGKKLLDDFNDEGQLDHAYDEIAEFGGEIMVIYLDLPKILYPRVTNTLYHPRIADLLFPSQPLLKHLAMDGVFMTVTEKTDFNQLQRNLLQEWVLRPVDPNTHQVYKSADYYLSQSEAEWWSDNEAWQSGRAIIEDDQSRGFVSESEHHPLVPKQKKFKPKHRKAYYGSTNRNTRLFVRPELIPLIDSNEDEFYGLENVDMVETELDNDYSSYQNSALMVGVEVV